MILNNMIVIKIYMYITLNKQEGDQLQFALAHILH